MTVKKRRRKAAKRADKLNTLLIRWGKLRADLDAVQADTPAEFIDGKSDADSWFKTARHAIEDTQSLIAHAYGRASARAIS
jgi:hypothetical protein